jgi:succinate dehydrogenase hydrophobic anchor subunit
VQQRGNEMTEQTIDFILTAASNLFLVLFIAWTVINMVAGERKHRENMKQLNALLDQLAKSKSTKGK